MRLFIGIDLTLEVIANLEGLLERLKPAAQINWSPPRNLHITTKFIGEWPEERLAELRNEGIRYVVLSPSKSSASFRIRMRRACFGPAFMPRTIWQASRAKLEKRSCLWVSPRKSALTRRI